MTTTQPPEEACISTDVATAASAQVSALFEDRLVKFDVLTIETPSLSTQEVVIRAAGESGDDDHRAYLDHRFNGANAQLAEEAKSELDSANEQLVWTAERDADINKRRQQRTPHEIVRQPKRVEEQTNGERTFFKIVLGSASVSLFVAWNMVSANMFNSGQFPALMEFPQSLSLYLMSFAAVVLSFLPKIHFDQLNNEKERKGFVRKLEVVTAVIGLVWAISVSVIFSPTADIGITSVDMAIDGDGDTGHLGAVLMFTQLATEVGMGALLWIFGLRLTEKGRLEVAYNSPAYITLVAEGDVLFVKRNAFEEYCGKLRGFLITMEEIRQAFIAEELERIKAECFRHEGLKRLAIIKELESHEERPDTEPPADH